MPINPPVEIAPEYTSRFARLSLNQRTNWGPFSYGGAIYVVQQLQTGDGNRLGVSKSTDGGQTWSVAAIKATINASGTSAATCDYKDGVVHIVYQDNADNVIYYTAFSFATDTFSASVGLVYGISFVAYMSFCKLATTYFLSFSAAYNINSQPLRYYVFNSNLEQVELGSIADAPAWVGPVLTGTDGRVHIFYENFSNLFYRSYKDGVFSEPQLIFNIISMPYKIGWPTVWKGAIYMPVTNDSDGIKLLVGSPETNPTWSTVQVSSSIPMVEATGITWNFMFAFGDANYLYLTWESRAAAGYGSPTNIIYANRSEDGLTWESDTLVYDTATYEGVTDWVYAHNIGAIPFEDGTIGYIFDLRDCAHTAYGSFSFEGGTAALTRLITDQLELSDDAFTQPITTFYPYALLIGDRLYLLDKLTVPTKGGKTPEKPVKPPNDFPPGGPGGAGCPAAFVIPNDSEPVIDPCFKQFFTIEN